MFKKFLKKYWLIFVFALIINIPIVIMGTIRTNKDITIKGDCQNINGFIDIESDYNESGSFSSIYVVDFEKSTILQNLICSNIKEADITDLNLNVNNLNDFERYEAGQIQKNSSISKAIIVAYEKAKINNDNIYIDYEFKGLKVTYYSKKSALRISDLIIKVNDTGLDVGSISFKKTLIDELYDNDNLDSFTILRNGSLITYNEEEIDYYNFNAYEIFDINYETITPSLSLKSTNVGGPSGGLLQTLSIYNRLTSFDYTNGLKIAGTGTINLSGNVGEIGGIKQKIYTAYDDNIDVFLCPASNYDEALIAYNNLKNKEKMALVKISNFTDAINYLEGLND